LPGLSERTGAGEHRLAALHAVNDARSVMENARRTVLGEAVSGDPAFKMVLAKALLGASAAEYLEAFAGGITEDDARLQTAFAFALRSQQIFDETRYEMNPETADRMDVVYADLLDAYGEREDPSEAEHLTGGIVGELDGLLGVEVGESDPPVSADSIINLLDDAGAEYRDGNSYLAASYATRAHVDYDRLLAQSMGDGRWHGMMYRRDVAMVGTLAHMIDMGAPEGQVAERLAAVLKMLNRVSDMLSEPDVAGRVGLQAPARAADKGRRRKAGLRHVADCREADRAGVGGTARRLRA